jgi:integrase
MTKGAEMKDKGLFQRGGVYWARVVVPKDLQPVVGKGPIRQTLDTRDRTEARARLAEFKAAKLAKFQLARKRLNPETVEASPEFLGTLAKAWRYDVLKADEASRLDPHGTGAANARAAAILAHSGTDRLTAGVLPASFLDDPDADPFGGLNHEQAAAIAGNWRAMLQAWKADAAGGHYGTARLAAEHQAQQAGRRLTWTGPDARKLLADFLGTMVATAEELVARTEGQSVPTPPAVAVVPQRPVKRVTLRDALEVWASTQPKEATIGKTRRAVERFEAFAGVTAPELASVTHAQADDFRRWLLNSGVARKTAKDTLYEVAKLFRQAKRRKEIPESPFDDLDRIKSAGRSKRKGWTIAELGTLFGDPVFSQYRIPPEFKAGADAAYWVPVLGLFTGARISELCQLRTADVVSVGREDGAGSMPFIAIQSDEDADGADDAEAKSVKTEAGNRLVPVHPTLVDLGFLEYVEAIRKAGAVQLFPAVKVPAKYTAGTYFSTWFGQFKTGHGFGRWKDFHAFRHTVRTRLSVARVPEPAIDILAGHESGAGRGSTGRQTYTHWEDHPAELAAEGAKLTYPGLSLPRVFKAPAWTPESAQTSPAASRTPRKTTAAK